MTQTVLARASFVALLAATLVLYVWGLDRNGWANAYYAAAVQAATQSWKAFFFGSLDSSNFITVDKAPAFLWVMDVSAKIFGVNTWSIQVPQALEGVTTVGLTYIGVRRWFGPAAALIAGAVVAVTPAAALMFRFDNPDALLVLLVTAGAYSTLRAVENGQTRWLVLAAAVIGTAFLAKMLQAFLIVPVLVLVYLVAGRPRFLQRIKQLVLAGITLVIASGWWVAVVELWPATARPYIGGSQTNSVVELIFGYNGLGRITGNETGSVVGRALGAAGAAISRWGPTGWDRLFSADFGGQVSWLIPSSLLLLLAGLLYMRHGARWDPARAAFMMWGGWLLITGLVFSFAQGIIHPYYTVALAPPIGSLIGAGSVVLWRRRASIGARLAMATAVGLAVWWSYTLLLRSPDWHPELRVLVVAGGIVTVILLLAGPSLSRVAMPVAAAGAIVVALAGPTAFTLNTVSTPHSGAIPSAGPAVASATGFGGFRTGGPPPGGFNGGPPAGRFTGAAPGPAGGFLNASSVGSQLASLLRASAGSYEWAAATVDANAAAGYELATGQAVMAIGGFNGTDPAPALAQFQSFVAQGKIHYFLGGGGPGGASGATSSAIVSWVSQNFTATTVDGVTVYDLTQPAG